MGDVQSRFVSSFLEFVGPFLRPDLNHQSTE